MNGSTRRPAVAQETQLSLRNEFGWAQVGVDTSANGPRLLVHSPRTGRTVWLDPLEVESLTQWRHEELVTIVLGREYDEQVASEGPHTTSEDGQ